LTGRFEKVEAFVEGKPVKLIENGKIIYKSFREESLAYDELFSQLRQQSVSHLGQVEFVYLETSGDLSIFYFTDDEVIPGLPILPDVYDFSCKEFIMGKTYACKHCGELKPETQNDNPCKICDQNEWILADSKLRLA